MYDFLNNTHSGLRWIALLLLVLAVFNSFSKWRFKKSYSAGDKLINLFTLISFHLQFTVGLILYFVSPKVSFSGGMMSNTVYRFFTIEHFLMMLAAVVIITLGRKRAEKTDSDTARHRRFLIWYGLALLLVLAAIPWPFRSELGGSWF